MQRRSKAFFINGGAGRVLSSIPALERYAEDSGDEYFVIVAEGGMDFYRGHPTLHKHVFEVWHKGLFENHIKDKDIVTPEPYRVHDYYNQNCSLAQAFDIEINGVEEPRPMDAPVINLNKMELLSGYNAVQQMKQATGKDKLIVVQPFGRSSQIMGEFIVDQSSRSFELGNIVNIINVLRKEYGVIIMSEFPVPVPGDTENPIAQPQESNMRLWASIIKQADHFLGCDSVGQHIAKAVGTTATVVTGSTVPVNISYPDDPDFDVIDNGADKRVYSPIRISMDDESDRANNDCMTMDEKAELDVIESCKSFLGEGKKFEGEVVPMQSSGCGTCATPAPVVEEQVVDAVFEEPTKQSDFNFNSGNLLGE